MDAQSVLGLIEQYGLPVILLGAAIYALYRFIVFSLYEVKNEFGRRHEDNAKAMSEVKVSLGEIKSDLRLLVGLMSKQN
ncbi:MAG: hypothetical protein Unbinned400contig1004_18 [Prokaryotic dsDNA virus sp.]|jgi:hypothetical protein|nr:MAG: hypothetical protein Unbinned400contig1004_18 [Prokaryotic dsDNA virus sp.]|tara:strand:- start:13052 stop:13288 length:237 start_codon:yes stop_codon:yes gene_type:complete